MLGELTDKFEIIDTLTANGLYSAPLRELYDDQLKVSLLLLAYASPTIEDYPGTPMVGFCKLIKYSENNKSFLEGAKKLNEFMRNYLETNKAVVMSELKNSQRWFGGQGCELSGDGPKECRYKDKSRCKKRHNQALESTHEDA